MINRDWRNIMNGLRIPTESGYCDQPSIVKATNGDWVCTVTTGKGREGAKGQYVSITRSSDRGRTWSEPIALEDPAWESAYSSLAVAPSGRIFCFYCSNLDHVPIEEVPLARYDMGGYYCCRCSDDNGISWSERFVVPIRDFDMDLEQEPAYREFHGKKLRFFWNVSRVFFDGTDFWSPLIKYHYTSEDIVTRSEGVLLKAVGLDRDPGTARWETLPDGTKGIRAPSGGGAVAEEQSYVILSDRTIFATYRTADGYAACAMSRDEGHSFEASYMTYPDGRRIKHNRAANFIWPIGKGKYLYWFNNHSGKNYQRRNPVWCLIGTETETDNGLRLSFSEPEILLYHESDHVMISYPDLLWDEGWYITETQKTEARIHRIDDQFIRRLTGETVIRHQPLCGYPAQHMPEIILSEDCFSDAADHCALTGKGLTIALDIENAQKNETLLTSMTENGGIRVYTDPEGYLAVETGDVMAACTLHGSMDLCDGNRHQAVIILDAQAGVWYAVIDGTMDDGGEKRTCGWKWINRKIRSIPGGSVHLAVSVKNWLCFDEALLTRDCRQLFT